MTMTAAAPTPPMVAVSIRAARGSVPFAARVAVIPSSVVTLAVAVIIGASSITGVASAAPLL